MLWVDEGIHRHYPAALSGGGSEQQQFRWLLRLLTFSYACGMYENEAIHRACASDTIFRIVSEDQVPFSSEITSFRRRHRSLLVAVLSDVLLSAVREQFGSSLTPSGPDGIRRLEENATERVDTARHLDNEG